MKKFNPVAKYAKRFNKSVVMKDRKREWKKTGGRCDLDADFYDSADGFYDEEVKDERIRTGQLSD